MVVEDNSIKCISYEEPEGFGMQERKKNAKLHMYQTKNSKSKKQIKPPRGKNCMHAQLSHAKQNYDLDIGQNQPAVSEENLFSRQLVRSKIKNKFCCEVKHNNYLIIDQTKIHVLNY